MQSNSTYFPSQRNKKFPMTITEILMSPDSVSIRLIRKISTIRSNAVFTAQAIHVASVAEKAIPCLECSETVVIFKATLQMGK